VRRLEIAPRALCRTELRQRRPWITLRQQDGAGRMSRKGFQVVSFELRGDRGKLIGRHPRRSDVFGLEQDLDTSGEQA
jgi:hypothetical protein